MPSKKYTAQKRAELKAKKAKQAKKGTTNKEKSNISLYAVIGVIIIVAIIAGIYLAFGNKANVTNNDEDNGTVVTNTAPVAAEDYFILEKNTTQFEIDCLANDNDPDDDLLNVTNLGDPSNGVFETIENITYYTPTLGFTGTDIVEYTIDDGNGGTATSKIHIIVADPDGNSIALFETSLGAFAIELYEDKAPITTKNFIDHANSGYYNGLIFHRVMSRFMIQGGDPLGTGTGGHAAEYHEGYGNPSNPDYWVIPDEFHEDLSNVRGTISMANSGPDTGGSQFFINVVDNTYLDYNKYLNENQEIVYDEVPYPQDKSKHAVFGMVIDGMDVVDSISEVETSSDRPLTDIVINTITIENR